MCSRAGGGPCGAAYARNSIESSAVERTSLIAILGHSAELTYIFLRLSTASSE